MKEINWKFECPLTDQHPQGLQCWECPHFNIVFTGHNGRYEQGVCLYDVDQKDQEAKNAANHIMP